MSANWLKTGEQSVAVAAAAAAEAEKRQQEKGKMWRFWLNKGEEGRMTFVDGDLGPQGFLTPPRFYEHNLQQNGKWGNLYVCPQMTSPESNEICPICAGGDKPYLVALFTVIDHRVVASKDGTKTYKDIPRLFAAKAQTFELLNKLAIKREGLSGVTFDVSRSQNDKSPSVGDLFDFVEKRAVETCQHAYTFDLKDEKSGQMLTYTKFVPAQYEEEITYRTGEELVKLGLGKPTGVMNAGGIMKPGGQPIGKPDAAQASKTYGEHL